MEHARQALVVGVRVDVLETDELPVGACSASSFRRCRCSFYPVSTSRLRTAS